MWDMIDYAETLLAHDGPRAHLLAALASGCAVQLLDACRLAIPDPDDLDTALELARISLVIAYREATR